MYRKPLVAGSVAVALLAGVAGMAMLAQARPTEPAMAASPSAESRDIVEVAGAAGSFKTLLKAAEAAGLVDALKSAGPLTVFAPTDEAFAQIDKHALADLLKPENKAKLARVLSYHVVPAKVSSADAAKLTFAPTLSGQRAKVQLKDGQLRINDSKVTATDIQAKNGVIHVIDRVLMPTQSNIVQLAQEAGSFGTLIKAAQAAGLAEALTADGPLTVLAPTDEAFAKIPKSVIKALLDPANKEQLASILKLHVIPARVYADEALAMKTGDALGGKLAFALKDGRASVTGGKTTATIVKTDLQASNGVVHVIDSILLPESLDVAALKSAASNTKSGNHSAMAMAMTSDKSSARALIELAIDKGVPLYNRGETEACAAIYEVTTRALIANPKTPEKIRTNLEAALAEASAPLDSDKRAWALRRGFDKALETMTSAGM